MTEKLLNRVSQYVASQKYNFDLFCKQNLKFRELSRSVLQSWCLSFKLTVRHNHSELARTEDSELQVTLTDTLSLSALTKLFMIRYKLFRISYLNLQIRYNTSELSEGQINSSFCSMSYQQSVWTLHCTGQLTYHVY